MKEFKQMLKEVSYFFLTYLVCTILFLMVFSKPDLLTSFKVITGIFYLYLLPGFMILLLFTDLNFLEKVIVGAIVGKTLTALIAYYLNVIANVSFRFSMVLPLVIVIICIIIRISINYHKRRKQGRV